MNTPKLLWSPDPQTVNRSTLMAYMHVIETKTRSRFDTYDDLWQWSVDHIDDFWTSLFDFFNLTYEGNLAPALIGNSMPEYSWFPEVRLNFAENLCRLAKPDQTALIALQENGTSKIFTWRELLNTAAAIQHQLSEWGLEPGDRVCGLLTNSFETTAALLAVTAGGMVWSCCSPDFGVESVLDRFDQIQPTVLLTNSQYSYGGKMFSLTEKNKAIAGQLTSVRHILNLSGNDVAVDDQRMVHLADLPQADYSLLFVRMPFSAPLWVLYSSGTTGSPKAITHSHGGVLLELQKYHAFHNDVRPGELFFWYSTTGWMMWNYLHGAWLMGASILVYDGSAGYPDIRRIWEISAEHRVTHLGTSAPYILANMKEGIKPKQQYDLSALRSIGSTGSPLPPEGFDYVFDAVKEDVWLTSMSGGTDVCTAFVGGCPIKPVYQGEIQCRALGCALFAFDEDGNAVEGVEGEMVITKPMPSMPIYFWNDTDNQKYRESYFEEYPGYWRHGDWIKITERKGIVIFGRSDATLNKQGIRIGTSEIYRSLDALPEIVDCLIVNIDKADGSHYMPLFVVLKPGLVLTEEIISTIKKQLRTSYSPRHVPDEILQVDDLPYTLSGKKMETPVKKILMGRPVDKSANRDTMRNPSSLDFFIEMAQRIKK